MSTTLSDMQSDTLRGPAPSENGASSDIAGGHSVAIRTAQREPCSFCGAVDWVEAHFALGIVCLTCWEGQRPAVAMPPNAHEQVQLADWISPQPQKGTEHAHR